LNIQVNFFDKGIGFDVYQLENSQEKIILALTNWFEGELKATKENFQFLEKHLSVSFKFVNQSIWAITTFYIK